MIILAGTVRAPADKLAAAQRAFATMIAATRAEPGCLGYSFAHDVLEPGLIRIFEVYTDQAAVDAHRAAPHFAAWRASWPALGIGDRNMAQYEIESVQQL
jgi:quinol monooxygenase YgiN